MDVVMLRREGMRIWKILKRIQLKSDHGVEKLGSDHSVEKLRSDHGVEKLRSDHGVEKLKSDHAGEGWDWTMQADNWVSAIGADNWVLWHWVEFSTVAVVDKFFGSRPAKMNWDLKHHKDMLNVGCVVSIIWLRKTFKNCVSLLVSKNRIQEVNKRFVSELQRVRLHLNMYLSVCLHMYMYCCDRHHQII